MDVFLFLMVLIFISKIIEMKRGSTVRVWRCQTEKKSHLGAPAEAAPADQLGKAVLMNKSQCSHAAI